MNEIDNITVGPERRVVFYPDELYNMARHERTYKCPVCGRGKETYNWSCSYCHKRGYSSEIKGFVLEINPGFFQRFVPRDDFRRWVERARKLIMFKDNPWCLLSQRGYTHPAVIKAAIRFAQSITVSRDLFREFIENATSYCGINMFAKESEVLNSLRADFDWVSDGILIRAARIGIRTASQMSLVA